MQNRRDAPSERLYDFLAWRAHFSLRAIQPAKQVLCSIAVGFQPMASPVTNAIGWKLTAVGHETRYAVYFVSKLNFTRYDLSIDHMDGRVIKFSS